MNNMESIERRLEEIKSRIDFLECEKEKIKADIEKENVTKLPGNPIDIAKYVIDSVQLNNSSIFGTVDGYEISLNEIKEIADHLQIYCEARKNA